MKYFFLILLAFVFVNCVNSQDQNVVDNKIASNIHFGDDTISLKRYARKLFLKKTLPKIAKGHSLNQDWGENGLIIKTGDLNGDKLKDVIIEYNIAPSQEEYNETGSGNVNLENIGLALYINNGKDLEYYGIYDNYPLAELKAINNNIIYLVEMDLADTDPMCCPSIRKDIHLKLKGKTLTEAK